MLSTEKSSWQKVHEGKTGSRETSWEVRKQSQKIEMGIKRGMFPWVPEMMIYPGKRKGREVLHQ